MYMKPTPIKTQQSNNKLIPAIVTGVMITALVVGSGVFVYEKNQNDTVQADMQAQIDTLKLQVATKTMVSALPSPTANPTANWKTYTLAEAKISFSYPADWGTVTVLHGRTSQGISPNIQFSANQDITAGTYSKDMSAGRGSEDHEYAIKIITLAGNDCQKITLSPTDTLSCSAIKTKSSTTAYYLGNLGDHTEGPGPQKLLTGYAQYPSTYNFPDFVFLSTNSSQQSANLIKQLLSTVKFL